MFDDLPLDSFLLPDLWCYQKRFHHLWNGMIAALRFHGIVVLRDDVLSQTYMSHVSLLLSSLINSGCVTSVNVYTPTTVQPITM